MEAPKPAPPHISPLGMWASKLSLRIVQFTLSIAIIGLVGSVMSAGFWALGTLICAAPPTIVSAVWAFSEGICILVRGGHRGIHPGACVGVDLLLWLGFIVSTVALWFLGVATAIASDTLDGLSNFNGDPDEWTDNSVSHTIDGLAAKGQALVGLGATLVILHLVTFVIACYETSVRNRSRHETIIQVVSTSTQYPGQPAYVSPVQGYNGGGYTKA